ncbi:hypothetical protein QJS04_geneDACA017839 [Acorus gramineus]|uniref:HAT C-terminal dimerisation domain-containing protein n=1 Tax=Acorus gramineus TaxID=55184 RepID=A0AAV9AKK9_ACOGR|nr:hypothetical protein QJS04_geneDACA017839 [Acorus gramineus]
MGYFKTVAKYRFCGKELTANSCSGTSHLIRHAAECIRKNVESKFQSQFSRTSTGQLSNFSFNQVVARRETVKYIIKTEQPFSKVEHPDFEEWIQKAFGPQFQPISRNTVKRDVEKLYAEEKTDLLVTLSNIPGRVCLTSDLWTSNQPLCYISLTAHFIDANWILQKRIICLSDLDAPHIEQAMATSIINQLQNWDIYEKNFTITLDNASSNSELQRYLQEPNVEEDGEGTFDVLAWWKGQENRFPVLSAMARDLLTFPPAQVASKSAFSTGNRVIDDYRSHLYLDVVEQCVCLRDWYKAQQRTQTILTEEALGDQFDDVVNLN